MNSYLRDLMIEQVTGDFLDTHLYNMGNPNIEEALFCKRDRISDKEEQLKGKDIILSSHGLHIKQAITDEKGQAHQYYPTFAFELSYVLYDNKSEIDKLNSSKTVNNWIDEQSNHHHFIHEGWLTDENKESEFYMLIWYNKLNGIDCTTLKGKLPWKDSDNVINEVKCCLIRRSSILKIIEKNGYSIQELREKAKEIRDSKQAGQHERKNESGRDNRIWFYFTESLPETPINVVIPQRELFYWAKAIFTVSEHGIDNIVIR